MHVPVAVVASIPALRHGWAAGLRRLRFSVVERESLAGWIRDESGMAALVLMEAAEELTTIIDLTDLARPSVVILLPHPSEDEQLRALGMGVTGVGDWATSTERVAVMIRAGLQGCSTIPADLMPRIAASLCQPAVGLDPLDCQLLKGLTGGATVPQLAMEVGYSERETFRRLRALYRRIGVNGRTGAVVQATRWGLTD